MAASTYYAQVQSLYVAYFGRPADKLGLEYYAKLLDANKGNDKAMLHDFANSAESKALYNQTALSAKVASMYQTLFGRAGDIEGITYWASEVQAGKVLLSEAAAAIAFNAQAADKAAFAAKLKAADAFTAKIDTAAELVAYETNPSVGRTWLSTVTSDATATTAAATIDATLTAAVTGTNTTAGQTFTLTSSIDTFTGTIGNDTFLGDNTSANAGDTLNGGEGVDTLKLYNTVNLGNISNIEEIFVSGNTGDVDVSLKAAVTKLTIADIAAPVAGQDYTLAAGQILSLENVADTGNTGNQIEVQTASTVTENTVKLNKVGDAAAAGVDVNVDINGTGVKTVNLESFGTASRISLINTGAAVTALNVSGTAAVTIDGNVPGATAIAISNTAGATLATAVAPNATTGLTITAVGGKDSVTLAQAAGANALTSKTAVDLGAGDDTLTISNLTAAGNIQDGASFKGGEGNDTLKLGDVDVIDATTGKLFSGFDVMDIGGGAAGTLNMNLIAANNGFNTLKLSAANAGAISVTNLAESASVVINAATGAALTINQKDSGAGSPDDVIGIAYDSRTAIGAQVGATTIADIETVNLATTSTGTNITHEITSLVINNATKVTLNASTAAADLKGGFNATSMVLFDASASAKNVSVAFNDTYTATAGVAAKGGAGDDTFVFTGADTGAAAATSLDFVVTGGVGADTITLAAVATGVDRVVYTAAADSTYAKYDNITNFDATAAGAQDLIVLSAFGFTGNQQGVKAVTTGVTVAADNSVVVASGSMTNFFVDTGVSRGVAAFDTGADVLVFVDANKDGNFSNGTDLVIKLTGVANGTDIDAADFVFA